MSDHLVAHALANHARFDDQRRFHSPEITRAFASALRAGCDGAQCESTGPEDVSLEPEVALSDVAVPVR